MSSPAKPAPKTVAIYCRKSTEEGLDREFNSLDAQRQSCEQFAASQRGEGWVVSPERYDDGGFSGGNTERPGLQRLMADVEAGKVQVIAVYKLDRMSRSLTDFVGLLQKLDAKQVAFVSVTQHFNTATPMGRLMLNILICFAQFERENTIERIRDKVAATKRQGRWCGGVPILGYDVAARKLVVNEFEAEQVRAIFALYLEKKGLVGVIRELDERGWTNKAWTSGTNHRRGGKAFIKSTLSRLLTNILYTGHIRYRGELIRGEHPAIITSATYEAVQNLLQRQRRSGGADRKTKHHALLKGLLGCAPCGCGMTYCWSRRGTKFYQYYTCDRSRSHGVDTCPMPSLPAAELERLVVEEIAAICRDPRLAGPVIAEAARQLASELDSLRTRVHDAEILVAKLGEHPERDRNRLVQAGVQLETARALLTDAEAAVIPKAAARTALAQFEPVWSALVPTERAQLLRALVERIQVDGQAGKVSFVFRAGGIAALARQVGTSSTAPGEP
ncbi:MAG: recombinase family protein [Planctomycetes bacterium]|nr:recombinase family protein [Planctomycetota bacterium]